MYSYWKIVVMYLTPFTREEYQDHYTTLTRTYFPLRNKRAPASNITLVFRVSNETLTTDEFLRGVKDVQDEVRL